MNINYEYYKVFYYVARYKSFTRAAKVLVNNQPNITRMMKRLESELGCTLFVRQRHGVALTPEGEKLYAHVSTAVEHIMCGEEEIAKERSLQSGVVTIAASEIALHCVLLPILKQFRKDYPGIRIRILNLSTPQAIDILKKGLADFAMITEPFELPAGLTFEVLRAVSEVPVCSQAFDLPDHAVLSGAQLKKYPLIGLGEKTGSFAFYSAYFEQMGLTFAPDIEAATANQILAMIQADLGIGFVPTDFLKPEDEEKLTILQMELPIPDRSICVLRRRDSSFGMAAAELERMLWQQGE